MYVENLFRDNGNITKLQKESHTFKMAYRFWREQLTERVSRLFVWGNTGTRSAGGIDQKQIEMPILLNGHVGITNEWHNKLTAFYGHYNGVSEYYDVFPNYSVYSPVYSKNLQIGINIETIDNNKLRNSITHLVHRYAIMLGHCEVSLVNAMINMRLEAVPSASTLREKKAIEDHRSALCNGKIEPILDPAFIGVQWTEISRNNSSIKDLMETRENLLKAFYQDIGVRVTWNKKGNMTVDEIGGNDAMLLMNIADMLDSRKRGADRVNEMFGTNWTVKLADELEESLYPDRNMEVVDDE